MSSKVKYRKLSDDEVGRLLKQGCECEDWGLVEVGSGFSSDRLRNTRLSGNIRIGSFNKSVELYGGVIQKTGIYNAWLNILQL